MGRRTQSRGGRWLGKAEAKALVKGKVRGSWQGEWSREDRGRELFGNVPVVGEVGCGERNRAEERVITRLKCGHSGLNGLLLLVGKHGTGCVIIVGN